MVDSSNTYWCVLPPCFAASQSESCGVCASKPTYLGHPHPSHLYQSEIFLNSNYCPKKVHCFRRSSAPSLKFVSRTNFCLLHLLAHYWWVIPMLNTIFSIFSSFFRMFDFTVDILSSCYEKNITIKRDHQTTKWDGYQISPWINDQCMISLFGSVYLFTYSCCELCQMAGEWLQGLQRVIIVFTNTSNIAPSLLLLLLLMLLLLLLLSLLLSGGCLQGGCKVFKQLSVFLLNLSIFVVFAIETTIIIRINNVLEKKQI